VAYHEIMQIGRAPQHRVALLADHTQDNVGTRGGVERRTAALEDLNLLFEFSFALCIRVDVRAVAV
jgi:hypothetical protein